MKKSSLYLSDADKNLLRSFAEGEGRSQADILRDALRMYKSHQKVERPATRESKAALPKRRSSLFGSGRGDGRGIADIPEEELLRGFGEDSMGTGTDKGSQD